MSTLMPCFQQNFFNPIEFVFKLSKTPNVEYTVQQAMIPGITLGKLDIATPHGPINEFGKVEYQPFSVTYKLNENLDNYLEIFNWMVELGVPNNYNEADHTTKYDARIIAINSAKEPSVEFIFHDVFPIDISPINMDTTLTDVQYVDISTTFSYDRMFIKLID